LTAVAVDLENTFKDRAAVAATGCRSCNKDIRLTITNMGGQPTKFYTIHLLYNFFSTVINKHKVIMKLEIFGIGLSFSWFTSKTDINAMINWINS
jgi:hypothetical protein